jgi:hypothetical protein
MEPWCACEAACERVTACVSACIRNHRARARGVVSRGHAGDGEGTGGWPASCGTINQFYARALVGRSTRVKF